LFYSESVVLQSHRFIAGVKLGNVTRPKIFLRPQKTKKRTEQQSKGNLPGKAKGDQALKA